jgi:hypothetical protein
MVWVKFVFITSTLRFFFCKQEVYIPLYLSLFLNLYHSSNKSSYFFFQNHTRFVLSKKKLDTCPKPGLTIHGYMIYRSDLDTNCLAPTLILVFNSLYSLRWCRWNVAENALISFTPNTPGHKNCKGIKGSCAVRTERTILSPSFLT